MLYFYSLCTHIFIFSHVVAGVLGEAVALSSVGLPRGSRETMAGMKDGAKNLCRWKYTRR